MRSRQNTPFVVWLRAALTGAVVLAACGLPAVANSDLPVGPSSGLPVPRFVSLKPERVNVRGGPTRTHEITWQYTRAGLPVEITAESDNWRRIRDWEGSEGWVYHSMLSGRRTALVTSKAKQELIPLFAAADDESRVVARLQAGVVASVRRCTGRWCQISGGGFDGWIAQERLWGVYPNETLP
jgi:SH3-like domain-containing protein